MTDKQIIIDGVDVNDCHNRTFYKNDEGDVQCKCYRFEDADSDTLLFGICKQHPHCYYKQLKAKEQECEELNKTITNLENIRDEFSTKLDQLKAENEELKDKLNCCFCNPYVELNDIEKQRKCIEVTECFRQQLDKLKVEQERLEEVNKELQYQLGCVTGREREHKANSDFWCKRCEDLQQQIDQLQPQVDTPTVAKEKLLIDKDTIEESLKIIIGENNKTIKGVLILWHKN